jgi:hypothetical protein
MRSLKYVPLAFKLHTAEKFVSIYCAANVNTLIEKGFELIPWFITGGNLALWRPPSVVSSIVI